MNGDLSGGAAVATMNIHFQLLGEVVNGIVNAIVNLPLNSIHSELMRFSVEFQTIDHSLWFELNLVNFHEN